MLELVRLGVVKVKAAVSGLFFIRLSSSEVPARRPSCLFRFLQRTLTMPGTMSQFEVVSFLGLDSTTGRSPACLSPCFIVTATRDFKPRV